VDRQGAAAPEQRSHRHPDWDGAIKHALERLQRELSPRLFYHSLRHTRDDVLPGVERLAALEAVAGDTLFMLRVAGAYHDIGFVVQYADHETASIRIATAALPRFGFAAAHIWTIARMIRATRLPHAPAGVLDAMLADPDLDSLGRDDFFVTSLALRVELAERGHVINEATWFARQLSFLQAHRYWTPSARRLRDAQKQRNIEILCARLAVLQTPGNELDQGPTMYA